MAINIINNGYMKRHHAFKLTPTNAREGSINPVGVKNPIIPIPNKYAFTISLPGTCTSVASEPMIGIVKTAIPEEEEMNNVKMIYKKNKVRMKMAGGSPEDKLAA